MIIFFKKIPGIFKIGRGTGVKRDNEFFLIIFKYN